MRQVKNIRKKVNDVIIYPGIFKVDHEKKTVKLSLRAAAIRDALDEAEINMDHLTDGCTWHPEYGSWMVRNIEHNT